jgi:hypothetical protein
VNGIIFVGLTFEYILSESSELFGPALVLQVSTLFSDSFRAMYLIPQTTTITVSQQWDCRIAL